jgi:hypothetical protein
MVVYAGSFQPFSSRAGQDTVVKLRFQFDRDLIETLKRSLRAYRPHAYPWKVCGGWLPSEHCWFVERGCWPYVRHTLEAAGHRVIDYQSVRR